MSKLTHPVYVYRTPGRNGVPRASWNEPDVPRSEYIATRVEYEPDDKFVDVNVIVVGDQRQRQRAVNVRQDEPEFRPGNILHKVRVPIDVSRNTRVMERRKVELETTRNELVEYAEHEHLEKLTELQLKVNKLSYALNSQLKRSLDGLTLALKDMMEFHKLAGAMPNDNFDSVAFTNTLLALREAGDQFEKLNGAKHSMFTGL